MKLVNIGFDIDGVLYPWHKVIYDYFKLENYKGTEYELWKYLRSASKIYQDNIVKIRHLYAKVSPKNSILSTLNLLANNYKIFYITARPEEIYNTTVKYLNDYNFPYSHNLFFTEDKLSIILDYEIRFFLDDSPTNIKTLLGYTNAYLMRQEHNKDHWGEFPQINYIQEVLGLFEKGLII